MPKSRGLLTRKIEPSDYSGESAAQRGDSRNLMPPQTGAVSAARQRHTGWLNIQHDRKHLLSHECVMIYKTYKGEQ